ncbi:MAG: hypothetical protein IJR11_03080 [Synergistaceae bacterium]|nr:hypothetical protein [Synergistaceae bacterium]
MYANAVISKNDTAMTCSESFRNMLDDSRDWAERSGLTEKDVDEAIKSVRRRKMS